MHRESAVHLILVVRVKQANITEMMSTVDDSTAYYICSVPMKEIMCPYAVRTIVECGGRESCLIVTIP